MSLMVIDRRTFLAGAAATAIAVPRSLQAGMSASSPATQFVSACKRADESYCLAFVTGDGRILREIPLNGRGHDIALSPDGVSGVAFARRPGRFAVSFDLDGARPPAVFEPPQDRHFYGHGVFSPDGRLLYATENDFEAGRGVLGVYDATDGFRRIGELDSHGVGPHDVIMLADGVTLAVANGGIDTHPASGREKLNLATMRPSLVFIDSRSGDLLTLHELDNSLHKLSIRHICADASGRVWFGGQWEDAIETAPELVGWGSRDEPLKLVQPREPLGAMLKGYIGSVAATGRGEIVTVSAPRAGRILHFNSQRGELVGQVSMKDGCGIAPASGMEVAMSSGEGLLEIAVPGNAPRSHVEFADLAFDNHMRVLRS
jgi:hypothetical protein